MNYNKQSNGLPTLVEHWNFALVIIPIALFELGREFLHTLDGVPWMSFAAASFGLILFGAALICCAKLPVYRSGHFFTFGIKSVPRGVRIYYRLGWGLFLLGAIISLGLLC